MQSLRNAILSYVRIAVPVNYGRFSHMNGRELIRACSSATSVYQNEIIDRVVGLVKKFDKIESAKVTETADFQKDLSLDSLDRVELVMAFEEEFSIEIPDADANKLKCCADVAKYITSSSKQGVSESS